MVDEDVEVGSVVAHIDARPIDQGFESAVPGYGLSVQAKVHAPTCHVHSCMPADLTTRLSPGLHCQCQRLMHKVVVLLLSPRMHIFEACLLPQRLHGDPVAAPYNICYISHVLLCA